MMPSKNAANKQMKPFERRNLLDLYKAQHAPQQMTPAAQDYICIATSASTPAMIPTDDDQQKRRYIPSFAPVKLFQASLQEVNMPSAAGVVINPNIEFQESLKAQDAFLKAEKAELKAKGHLD